jgi:hypothetical protein
MCEAEVLSDSTSRRKLLTTLAGIGLGGGIRLPIGRAAEVPEFHLHPHYREQTELDAAILQVKPGSDAFPIERDHDAVAAILAEWSRDLLESPRQLQSIGK